MNGIVLTKTQANPMKIFSLTLFIAFIHCQLFCQVDGQEIDKVIKLDGKISVSQDSERWLKISVPFLINEHPDLLNMQGKRPETIEEMFNPLFLNNLKIRIWISFLNEFKRKEFRGDRKDVRYFDYYSAEIECLSMEIDRKTKKAEFLFPATIAKKCELGNYPKLTGYVLEFSRNGETFEVSDQTSFLNYDKDEYLEKYRMEALNKSSSNEGILIPGYTINDIFLKDLGPVLRK